MLRLLSTGCPKCEILKKKLDAKGIEYTEINNPEVIKSFGVDAVPVLLFERDEKLNFKEAIDWINHVQ